MNVARETELYEALVSLFDRPIAFQRPLVTLTGSVNAALMLSQAIFWHRRASREDGWWYKTSVEWEEETGLTRREQGTARKALTKLGFWLEQRRGIPAKLFYRLDLQRLVTRLAGQSHQDVTDEHIRGRRSRHSITENTQETTAETIKPAPAEAVAAREGSASAPAPGSDPVDAASPPEAVPTRKAGTARAPTPHQRVIDAYHAAHVAARAGAKPVIDGRGARHVRELLAGGLDADALAAVMPRYLASRVGWEAEQGHPLHLVGSWYQREASGAPRVGRPGRPVEVRAPDARDVLAEKARREAALDRIRARRGAEPEVAS